MARKGRNVDTKGRKTRSKSAQQPRDPARARESASSRESASTKPSFGERAKDRRERVRAIGGTKSQSGAQRERRRGALTFVRESYGELRKVDWPNQKQLANATIVVILAVAIVGFYLYAVDEVVSRFVRDLLLAG